MRSLAHEVREAGYYSVILDGWDSQSREVLSDVYFYRLKARDVTATKRMLLLK